MARAEEGCEGAAEQTLEGFAKTHGLTTLGIGAAVYAVWKAYLQNPSGEKLDAVVNALGRETAGLVIPGFGKVKQGGQLVI